GHVACLALVGLEDEERRSREAREPFVQADPDEGGARLPVANLGLQRVPLVRCHIRRGRDDEIPTLGGGVPIPPPHPPLPTQTLRRLPRPPHSRPGASHPEHHPPPPPPP